MGVFEILQTTSLGSNGSGALAAFVGLLFGVGIVVFLVAVLLLVLTFVGKWKVFEKMGLDGGLVFVPFYSDWKLYEKVWKPVPIFFVMLGLSLVSSGYSTITYGFSSREDNAFVALIMLCVGVTIFILRTIYLYKISLAMGHGGGMTFLGVFLEPVYWMVLAFGKSVYVGNSTEVGSNFGKYLDNGDASKNEASSIE